MFLPAPTLCSQKISVFIHAVILTTAKMTPQTIESVLKVNYSTQMSYKHGQGQDITQPPSSFTVTKTQIDKDYTCIMLILVTSKEASSCNFSGNSLKERRNRKLFIKLINCQVICYTILLCELQVGHFNSSVLTQSLLLLAISINLIHAYLAHNPNVMLAISEAMSVSPIKCPRKRIPCKYMPFVPFFPTSSAPTFPYLCLSVDTLKYIYIYIYFKVNF